MSHPGRMLSRTRILSNVWGCAEDPLTNIVDLYVRRLRKKLDDPDPGLIVTARGFGYRLDPDRPLEPTAEAGDDLLFLVASAGEHTD